MRTAYTNAHTSAISSLLYVYGNQGLRVHVHISNVQKKNISQFYSQNMDRKSLSSGDFNPRKEKIFKCNDCDASFAQRWSLTRHDFAVHQGQKHQCSCGKQFPCKDHLKRHKQKCPGQLIQGQIVDIQPFQSLLDSLYYSGFQ